jgi:hypothetical protein
MQEEQQPPEPSGQWEYSNDESGYSQPNTPLPPQSVTWSASEYIAHEKGSGWYSLLAVVVVVTAGLVYLFTRENISAIIILVIGVVFGTFAARKPQELQYIVDDRGVHIGPRVYFFNQFKSFAIIEEGAIHSVMLMPLQRFMPPLSIYFAPEDEDKIVNALSHYLAYEDRKQDMVDRIMRKIRF